MDLKEIDTCELMKELASREGVEKIRIPVDGRGCVSAEPPYEEENTLYKSRDGCVYFYDEIRTGPEVILRIID